MVFFSFSFGSFLFFFVVFFVVGRGVIERIDHIWAIKKHSLIPVQ